MAGAPSPHLQIVEPQPAHVPVCDDELVARAQGDPEAFAVLYGGTSLRSTDTAITASPRRWRPRMRPARSS